MAGPVLSRDATVTYNQFMQEASEHYRKAEWEEMSRALERAKVCCDEAGFPDRTRCKQKIFEQYGSLKRRFGHPEEAAIILEEGLRLNTADGNESFDELVAEADPNDPSILEDPAEVGLLNNPERLSILGELGTVYRHMNNMTNAARAFEFQYQLASRLAWQAEAEACRAVGNAGWVRYETVIRDPKSPESGALLDRAIQDIEERVRRAKELQRKLAPYADDRDAQLFAKKAHQWEAIGVVRLVMCYIAKKDFKKALEYGELGTEVCKTLTDPTSRAHGRFYHGYALWHNGFKDEAKKLFTFWSVEDARDKCTPAIAFCKEPLEEYRRYLRFLVDAGVEMLHVDEQGYSALDYAVFAGDDETTKIVLRSMNDSDEQIEKLTHQARLRKNYRIILQDHFRPTFGSGGDLIRTAKGVYAQLLDNNPEMASVFDRFKYVKYNTFKKHGRLPWYNEPGIVQEYRKGTNCGEDVTVAFLSYRWIGKPGSGEPDDSRNSQYHRMCDALDKLKTQEGISEDSLGIWLDIACIDQTNKGAGIATLPLVVSQCNYMVSLVDMKGDFQYYTRAWCCSEALLMETLERSYRKHRRYEHLLTNPKRPQGQLVEGRVVGNLIASEQGLTDTADKPQIQFLERQTKLLGKSETS